ncbi:MAG: hypothetical protein WC554_08485 [Clostridia bacterium]
MENFSVGKIVGAVIGFFVVIAILMVALWGFGVFTADIKGQGEAHKEIHSKEFRLESYNYFFDQYHSILALEGQIDVNISMLKSMEEGTKDYNRIRTNVVALQSLRHQAIQAYNAEASKDYTAGQFRDNNLPYQIEDTEYPKGGI